MSSNRTHSFLHGKQAASLDVASGRWRLSLPFRSNFERPGGTQRDWPASPSSGGVMPSVDRPGRRMTGQPVTMVVPARHEGVHNDTTPCSVGPLLDLVVPCLGLPCEWPTRRYLLLQPARHFGRPSRWVGQAAGTRMVKMSG